MSKRHLAAYATLLYIISQSVLEPEKLIKHHLKEAVSSGLLTQSEAEYVKRLIRCIERKRKVAETLYEAARACL